MMLINDFYSIESKILEGETNTYTIRLNHEHEIIKAHFPGNPIVPGVCTIQIVKEICEDICGRCLALKCIKNVKFLQMISPLEVDEINVEINLNMLNGGVVEVKAVVSSKKLVFTKLSLLLQIQ